MKIQKFKLIDGGLSGIEVEGIESSQKEDNTTVLVDSRKKYHVPVPSDITQLVQALKYYLLELCQLLPANADNFFEENKYRKMRDYDKTMDRHWYAHVEALVRACTITGFSFRDKIIIVTGKMRGMEDSVYALNSGAFNTETIAKDAFEEDLIEVVSEIRKEIRSFVEDARIRKMNSRQYLLNLFEKDEKKADQVRAMTDEETQAEQVKILEQKGWIVFKGEEVMEEIKKTGDELPPEPEPEPEIEEIQPVQETEIEEVKLPADLTFLPETAENVPSKKSKITRPKIKAEQN